MKIYANEIMLAKKNLNLRAQDPAQAPVPTQVPEQNQLGMSNVAFQGANLSALKNKGLAAMMALMTLAGAASLQSCEKTEYVPGKDVNITNTVTVTVDFGKMEALLQKLVEQNEKLYEQGKLTQDQLAQANAFLMQMLTQLAAIQSAQGDTQKMMQEFYAKMFMYMESNEANQQVIINLLEANGKSNEEAKQFILDLINEVKAGNLKDAEAYDKIMQELGQINVTLKDILDQLKDISADIKSFRESYESGKKENMEMMTNIYENGQMQTAYLRAIGQGLSVVNENLIGLNRNVIELKNIVADPKKFEELMKKLDEMDKNSLDYKKLQDMFNQLKVDLKDVMIWATGDIKDAINKVTLKIGDFEQTYISTEKEQTEQLININKNLQVIANFPGLDQKDLMAALDELKGAINNNTDVVGSKLDKISEQIDKLQQQIDALLREVGTLSSNVNTYAEIFSKKFDSALERLVQEFNNLGTQIKDELRITNNYLKSLESKVDELNVKIDKFEQISGGGMTLEEFENFMKDRDEAQYKKYAELIMGLGLKIDITNATLADLKAAIEGWKQDQKDYTEQLGRIIELLENAPDYSDKLDEIKELLKNFKCNCSCGGNSGSNEGIIGDLTDLLG